MQSEGAEGGLLHIDGLTLEAVEAEIRRAEELLSRDIALDPPPAGNVGFGPADQRRRERMPADERREIIAKLAKERPAHAKRDPNPSQGELPSDATLEGSVPPVTPSDAVTLDSLAYSSTGLTPVPLEDLDETASGPDKSSCGGRYASPNSREQLIQRLLAERRAKLTEQSEARADEERILAEQRRRAENFGTPFHTAVDPPRAAPPSASTSTSAAARESQPPRPARIASSTQSSPLHTRFAGQRSGTEGTQERRHQSSNVEARTLQSASLVSSTRSSPPHPQEADTRTLTHDATDRRRPASASPPKRRVRVDAKSAASGRKTGSNRQNGSLGKQRQVFSRKSLEEVKREVERERAKDCTFKPKINTRYRGSKQRGQATAAERIDRLAEPRDEYWADKERRRLELEMDEKKKCTFQPDISKAQGPIERAADGHRKRRVPPRGKGASTRQGAPATRHTQVAHHETMQRQHLRSQGGRKNARATSEPWEVKVQAAYRSGVPIEQRLYRDASERYNEREREKRELEDAEMRAHPYRPAVNAVSKEILRHSTEYRPIQERVGQVQREREERLHRARLQRERDDPDLTFKPQISHVSKRIARSVIAASGDPHDFNVTERLSKDATTLEAKRARRQQVWAQHQAEQCSFAPAVSRNTERIIKNNPSLQRDFLTRQRAYEERQKVRGENRKAAYVTHVEGGGQCTFKPSIGNTDDILTQSRPDRLAETAEERYERLSKKDSDRNTKLREYISDRHYAQYDFKPKINRISKALGRSTGGFESLYRNEKAKDSLKNATRAEAERFGENCPFEPEIHEAPGLDHDAIRAHKPIEHNNPDAVLEQIENVRRERELKLQQVRRNAEYDSLKECTFEPELHSREEVPQPTGPVVVRGLGRYLELKEMAKRKDEERRDREERAFMVRAASRPAAYTVPQPFTLSTNNKRREQRTSKLRDEAESAALKECTFRPKTLYSENRHILDSLLQEDRDT